MDAKIPAAELSFAGIGGTGGGEATELKGLPALGLKLVNSVEALAS